jgi:hypothetical protein
MLCTMIWPAAGAAHGVHGMAKTDLRGNASEGELHAQLQARGGGTGSDCGGNKSGCGREAGWPEGHVTWQGDR